MRFVDQNGNVLIELPDPLAARMRALAHAKFPNETGGIVIGHYDDVHRSALVRCVTGPPRDSVNAPFSFHRGIRGLDALLARAWLRGLYYLGEWHFHPEARPRASWIDKLQIAEFARTAMMRCPEPVLFIVGLPDCGGHVAGYVYQGRLLRLKTLPSHGSRSRIGRGFGDQWNRQVPRRGPV
jgi:hypothetical protein